MGMQEYSIIAKGLRKTCENISFLLGISGRTPGAKGARGSCEDALRRSW
jgi:hypothetical protein